MPIDSNGKRREGSESERLRVLCLHTQGRTYSQIARETSYSKAAAHHIVKTYENQLRAGNGNDGEKRLLENKKRSGRPKKIQKEEIEKLVDIVKDTPGLTLEEVKERARLNHVCTRIVGNALRAEGFYSKREKNSGINRRRRQSPEEHVEDSEEERTEDPKERIEDSKEHGEVAKE